MPIAVENSTLYDTPEQMVRRIRNAIVTRPRSVEYRHISEATAIPQHWIEKFAKGNIKMPEFSRVIRLHCYMIGGSIEFVSKL